MSETDAYGYPSPPAPPRKPLYFAEPPPQPVLRRVLFFAGSLALSWVLLYWITKGDAWLATGFSVILLVHELGHLLTMRAFGYTGLRMVFIPLLGAYVSGKRSRSVQSQEIMVALAGPIPGVLVASLAFVFGGPFSELAQKLLFITLIINVINLLPFMPLDGGRILHYLLGRQDVFYTFLMNVLVAVLGAVLYLSSGSFIWIFVGLTSGQTAIRNWRSIPPRRRMVADGIDYHRRYEDLTDTEFLKLRRYLVYYNANEFEYVAQPNADPHPEQQKREELVIRSLLEEPVDYNLSLIGQLLTVLVWLGALAAPVLVFGPERVMDFLYDFFGR